MKFIKDIFKGGVEGIFGGVTNIIKSVKADPTKVVLLEGEIIKVKADIEGRIIAAESATISAINETMRSEANSEHWAQWVWRPTVGFTFCATIINNYILYPYFASAGMQRIDIPETVWLAMLTILGAAAYTRGTEKIARFNSR